MNHVKRLSAMHVAPLLRVSQHYRFRDDLQWDLFKCPLCDHSVQAWELYYKRCKLWRLVRESREVWQEQQKGSFFACSMCKGVCLNSARIHRNSLSATAAGPGSSFRL